MSEIVACGYGGLNRRISGEVVEWKDAFFEGASDLHGNIVHCPKQNPLFQTAFLVESKVKAILMSYGGKNYHPLILASDAQIPAIAGLGEVHLNGMDVTVDSTNGHVYKGSDAEIPVDTIDEKSESSDDSKIPVYVNVGHPFGYSAAKNTRASGVGLLRTEFVAVRTLAKNLTLRVNDKERLIELIKQSNEADVLYSIASDPSMGYLLREEFISAFTEIAECFKGRDIIVRTPDIARSFSDVIGNRGIRRCVSEGCRFMKIIAEAVKEVLSESPSIAKFGIILPLVSHFSQIRITVDSLYEAGLSITGFKDSKNPCVNFGWEIEQPAASLKNHLWLKTYQAEYGCAPYVVGIGTNDLTQFSLALGRDVAENEREESVRKYLSDLYDETDFSVLRQIWTVTKECKEFGTRVMMLGQAAARSDMTPLLFEMNVVPSVGVESVRKVKKMAASHSNRPSSRSPLSDYIENYCLRFPEETRPSVRSYLDQIFR